MPSFPNNPIPMLASLSIDTSLAPSPIERVIFDQSAFLIILQISAFYFGEIQQAMTASHVFAISTKISLHLIIPIKAFASIIIAHFFYDFQSLSFSSSNSGVNKSIACSSLCTSQICISYEISLQANPIFLAVSSLSPVSIHTLIFASQNSCIVSGT